MKKIMLSISISLCLSLYAIAGSVVASVTYATYNSPVGSFADIYVEVLGSSMRYIDVGEGKYEARLGVVITITGEEGEVERDSVILISPRSDKILDFKHLFRYPLEDGEYEANVDLYDVYFPNKRLSAKIHLSLHYEMESVTVSDILLLSDFTPSNKNSKYVKSGMLLEPLPFNTCDAKQRQLSYYFEVYGTERYLSEPFIVKAEIYKDGQEGAPTGTFYKRVEAAEVVPVLLVSELSALAPGYYQLHVEILDRNKKMRTSKSIGFTKLGPGVEKSKKLKQPLEWVKELSPGELRYSLKALAPVLEDRPNVKINKLLRTNDTEGMRLLLSQLWLEAYPKNSEQAYNKYMTVAKRIDKKYHSGFGYGFESDRGRVYMKYGVPSHVITEESEPTAFPYEIWSYDKLPDGQSKIKFLFYNPSLASGQMILLHSNAIGEINNDKWERILYSKASSDPQPANYVDAKHAPEGFMRRAREYFEDN